MFIFGKKTKSKKDLVAKKLIEDFPLASRVRENFVEHFKLNDSCDTEEKLLQITQKLNQNQVTRSYNCWGILGHLCC
jgi:hypothetical protein